MFGLEVVAVVPFCVAVWRLGQKVADQQHLIEQHEATITSQQEVLEKLSGVEGNVPLGISGRTIALASVGVVACMTVNYTYRLSLLRRNVAPPSTYQPTAAAFEAEECVVCLTNKKDTFCAPCQHFAMCWPCSQNFLNKPCPICRKTIEFTQFTFDT